ncbi:hypothetical protein NKW44_15105 [Acetobacter lovaniensis]|jgi:hypothetical protein|uniref:hypothetical protein n=1 Tax=Acetobacter lovaniensis TaxID=104100 RepID=UPI00209D1A2E|nr:hypothetical protein [Acetobacter lovaniensis]MCP1240979.1 hypothetical protein [Acetobacter lovaniensis]
MRFNPQFKLTFSKMDIQFDIEGRQNKNQEIQLFTAPAEITVIDPLREINGTQMVELGLTHQALMRWQAIDIGCLCRRDVRGPDRSVVQETFRVISFLPVGQGNRFMEVKLSLITAQ